jgi:hypothetical protein
MQFKNSETEEEGILGDQENNGHLKQEQSNGPILEVRNEIKIL